VDAIRHLTAEVVTKNADADTLRRAAELVEQAGALLAEHTELVVRIHPMEHESQDPHAWFPYSPLIGHMNPIAAPIEVEVGDDGHLHAHGAFPAPYEGPPACVHGGIIAALFDELLGAANIVNRTPGMTGTLTIRYERPTPLRAELTAESWTESVDGRKIRAAGVIRHNGEVTARAEGLFIQPRPEHWAHHFPDEARGF
jgi:acyl-CoA thioesterase FadM